MQASLSESTHADDVLIIGAGQAGLSVSYHLTRLGQPHRLLERARIGNSWRRERWDSFTLVTPNWMNRLPDFPYRGPDPEGFLSGPQVVRYLEGFAASFAAPVTFGVEVERLAREGGHFIVTARDRDYAARQVVVATGVHHRPRIPSAGRESACGIAQIHSCQYRNPSRLRPGAVLVVGSGQSGMQIAEELLESGRRVYLSVSRAGREPRRYRGRDISHWIELMGGFDRPLADPNNPVERARAKPHCSGKDGGRALNLWDFAERGMVLTGKLESAAGTRVRFAGDLRRNLRAADKASFDLMAEIDAFIAAQGITAPAPDAANSDDGMPARQPLIEERRELDLAAAGISNVIWATGYHTDFTWIDLPVFDAAGFPRQSQGVTACPGLYFCGLPWAEGLKSNLLFGIGEAAEIIARQVTQAGLAAA